MNSTSSSSTASYRPTPALSSYRSASVAVAEEDEPVIEGATSTSSSAVAQHHRTSSPTPHTSSSLSSSSTRTDDQETDTATATATAAPPAATTASARRPRTAPERTLSSLPRKKCWICFGEQSEEDQGSAEARREWVHACRCTLVAHSDCLLTWYSTSLQSFSPPRRPQCPVCATPYLITQSHFPFLSLYKSLLHRWDRLTSAIAFGGILGAGWAVAAGYGILATKAWAGEEVLRVLLWGEDEDGRGGRWRYWLNLPLIPLTLILSRTPLIDSLLPFLPLTLVLSTSPSSSSSSSPSPLSSLTFQYPPSPTLTLCLLPWARWAYLKLRRSVFSLVLAPSSETETPSAAEGGWREFINSLRLPEPELDEEAPPAPAQLEAQVEIDLLPPGPANPPPAAQPQQQHQRLRLGLSRLTSLLVGALLYPALSSAAGGVLFWLASRGGTRPASAFIRSLRRVLGLTALLSGGGWWTGGRGRVKARMGDPVWIRTTLGGGLLLVLRDGVALLAAVLEKRRRGSRRVRGFGLGELEFDPPEVVEEEREDGREWSAGRDDRGREARVVVGL